MATLQRIGSNTCPRKTSRPVQTRMYSNSTLARIIVEPAYKEQTSAMLEKHMARALNALGCFVAKNPLGGMHTVDRRRYKDLREDFAPVTL